MKRIAYILLVFSIILPVHIMALELPKLYSDKVLLYDFKTDEILYDKGGNIEANIASLTKIMTTITAIENIENLDEVVTVDDGVLREIPYDASIAGLKSGDRVSYRDLLYASILPSGADATTALAHNIAGSTAKFVEMMNEKAKELGLEHTHFANVTGYDILNHHSTTREILQILKYALENPTFEEIYKTRSYKLSNGLNVQSTLNTYNRYMKADLSSILGSKTGYTGNAGMCMSALFKTNGREMILITLGAPYSYTAPYNLQDTVKVISYLDETYDDVVLFEKGKELVRIPIEGAVQDEFVVKVSEDIVKYAEKEYDDEDVRFEFEGVNNLAYKNSYGEKIGELKYYYKEELLKSEIVYLTEELKFSLEKFVIKYRTEIIISASIVVVLFAISIIAFRKKKRKKRRMRK